MEETTIANIYKAMVYIIIAFFMFIALLCNIYLTNDPEHWIFIGDPALAELSLGASMFAIAICLSMSLLNRHTENAKERHIPTYKILTVILLFTLIPSGAYISRFFGDWAELRKELLINNRDAFEFTFTKVNKTVKVYPIKNGVFHVDFGKGLNGWFYYSTMWCHHSD